jgi:hypothetical protein
LYFLAVVSERVPLDWARTQDGLGMTLTPSVLAISLCSFPCAARSFARVSFDAISTVEYHFFPAIAASL